MKPTNDPVFRRRLPLATALALALAHGSTALSASTTRVASAGGQILLVQNCNDSGPGSLREAYAAAVDGDRVDLGQLACSTITLTGGPIVSGPDPGYVTLQGSYMQRVTIDANHAGRAIVHHGSRIAVNYANVTAGISNDADGGGCVYSDGDATFRGMTLSDCAVSTTGSTAARGGGVRALGAVFLSQSVVTGNRVHAAAANADGGGIHALLLITDSQSTVSGNVASGDGSHYARGGGAFASEYLRANNTTFSGNRAETGGALWVGSGATFVTPNMTNTTISGNRSEGAAGGVYASGGVKFFNCTITGNTSVFDFGAGVYASGTMEMHSTIAANNSSGDGLNASDVAGPVGGTLTGARNLVIASTLVLPVDTIAADPMLGPLADNGGNVATHALLAGSPAIDAGDDPGNQPYDERGSFCTPSGHCEAAERTVGVATDIGAFEFGAPDHYFADGFEENN